jgi:membrane-associated PAP2 superfamily phosphatase
MPSVIRRSQCGFWTWHLWVPLMLVLLVSALIELLALDQQLASWIYQLEGGRWALRDHWLTNELLHTGGKRLSLLIALLCLAGLASTFVKKSLVSYRPIFIYLCVSAIAASALVSFIKHDLAVSCPWEFAPYGGELAYVSVWQQLWLRTGAGCFPAAHATAGYAWVCVYFAGRALAAPWAKKALLAAVLLGVLLGGAQQLRGAHFISHDLWSLAVCWLVALLCYRLLLMPASSVVTKLSSESVDLA